MKTSIALAGILLAGTSIISAQAINGAGATFPYPIYGKWFEEFRQKNPSIEINYQSKGSGAGIAQLTEGTVDFGASDMPMKDEQIAALKVKALHFPTVLGGLVPTYNLPGLADLKFSSEMLAGIFLGKITKWNDAKIRSEGAALSDGAGRLGADLQSARLGGSEVFIGDVGRHFPRQDHQVERRKDRESQSRHQTAGHRHHRGASLRWQWYHFRVHRLSFEDQPGMESRSGIEYLHQVADRCGPAGK